MGKVADYIKHLKRATIKNQERALLEIIDKHKHFLIDIVTAQLLNGMDGNGEFLQAYRSENYAEMKLHLNPKGVTDLRLTGAFWDGFFAVVKKFPIVIDSKDKKRDALVKKYGQAIFWPSQEGKTVFIEFIERALRDYYRGVYSLR
jgi:hypothetical protein